ncbi:hypothetical protein RRG08_011134 [Elysia crispata]|uniref:Uncharacterized protein n=1 Tax=Elysia crispata TaxID=231223 RepID=A0AAE1A0G6_9GAST|nr:hypothetical protein RRG08_011134 [Elysia crispata]
MWRRHGDSGRASERLEIGHSDIAAPLVELELLRLFDLEMKDGDLGGENLLRQTAAGERKALLAVTTADL